MATHYARHLERLQRGEALEANAVLALCERVKDLLVEDDNVVRVAAPVAVCGDIHGQFHDLLELFKLAGQAPATSYVFLGDFVDRGAMSVETISLLCVLKASYPERVTLLRGNHESRQTTQVYGFQIECMKKYDGDARIYKAFMELFDFLPLGALIDDRLLCLHGGLSPALHHLDQLRMLDRFQEIPPDGIFADIVWSDPDSKTLGFHMVGGAAAQTVDSRSRSCFFLSAVAQRSRLHLRRGRGREVPAHEQAAAHGTRAPVVHGGLPGALQRDLLHGLERAQLLPPLRKPRGRHGCRRPPRRSSTLVLLLSSYSVN
ncbi:unnamed protein product [Phytophthora lilii]|uniref:Serine/threonine-protein phosphatase n=1 Tax=Phytophthora lilii TaxID=2077276 RepID=A0A9W6X1B8_9STRA|nr:unnamed protein product [Phytophthora lilii]